MSGATERSRRRLVPAQRHGACAQKPGLRGSVRRRPRLPRHQPREPAPPEPASPIVHAMPVWEPPLSKSALPATMAHELPVETAPPSGAGHALRGPKPPKVAVRRFADPFAGSDDGTSCRLCGYLVEPAREKRGLLTCSTCG